MQHIAWSAGALVGANGVGTGVVTGHIRTGTFINVYRPGRCNGKYITCTFTNAHSHTYTPVPQLISNTPPSLTAHTPPSLIAHTPSSLTAHTPPPLTAHTPPSLTAHTPPHHGKCVHHC